MSTRYWVVGGEYDGPDFRALVPGTEKMVGPFEDEGKEEGPKANHPSWISSFGLPTRIPPISRKEWVW